MNGTWVEGEPVRREDWADKLDTDIDAAFDRMGDEHTELRVSLQEHSSRSRVDEHRSFEKKTEEQLNALGEDEDPSEELKDHRAELAEPVTSITLRNVIVGQGASARHVPYLRVLRSHVSAWTLGRSGTYEGPPTS